MTVKLIKKEEDYVKVEILMSGLLHNRTARLRNEFFDKEFISASEYMINPNCTDKKDIYTCPKKLLEKFEWWFLNVDEVNYFYNKCYVGDLTKDAAILLDNLNTIYYSYNEQFDKSYWKFIEEYKIFVGVFT